MVKASADIKKIERHYIPTDFRLTTWESIEPFVTELDGRKIESKADLEKWLADMNELEAVVREDVCCL